MGPQTKEVLDAMVQDAGRDGFSLLRVDGGASRNDVLMQLQADAIQVLRSKKHVSLGMIHCQSPADMSQSLSLVRLDPSGIREMSSYFGS